MRWWLVFLLFPAACTSPSPNASPAQQAEVRLDLKELAPGVWLHTSYQVLETVGLFPSNGLAVETEDGLILVDTAWGVPETEVLLSRLRAETGKEVIAAVVTHAHDDRMVGAGVLEARGIPVFATALTNEDAEVRGLIPADRTFDPARTPNLLASAGLTVFYPGEGHTRDNIVVYHAPSHILFGGCLIRSAFTGSMGNTVDGNLTTWGRSALAAGEAFPEAEIVVPGHGVPGGPDLFGHTATLAAKAAPG